MIRVGVLALQGDYQAHVEALERAAAKVGMPLEVVEVRSAEDLAPLAGLVMPGGESTTLLKLLAIDGLGVAIRRWVTEQGGSVFGTCAGSILLSSEVVNPAQDSLRLLEATIERNAYGRQVDSFIERLPTGEGSPFGRMPVEAVFIRAPRFVRVGPGIEILLRRGDEAVLLRKDRVMAATFHPELTSDTRVHELFLKDVLACAS